MKNTYFYVIAFCFLSLSSAAQVYVSNAGMDLPGYGTMADPYHSIQYAHDQAGVTVIYVKGDRYFLGAGISITKSVIITKYDTGEVILDGIGLTAPYTSLININNTSNVTLDSISFENCIGIGASAIYVHGACNNITIRNCRMWNIGWQSNNLLSPPTNMGDHNAHAIHVTGDNPLAIKHISISNCHISNCATGFSEALTINGNVDTFLIENNFVDSIQNIGIDVAGSYGINSDPALDQARNGTIRGNTVSHCMSALRFSAGIYLDGAINCRIEKNLVFENAVGISIGAEQTLPAGSNNVAGNIIDNNIVFGNAAAGIYIGTSNPSNTIHTTVVSNNIFFKNRTGATINGISQVGPESAAQYGDVNGGEIHLFNSDSTLFQNNISYAINAHQNLLALNTYTVEHFRSDYNIYYRDDNTISLEIVNGIASFNGSTVGGYFDINGFKAYGVDSNSLSVNPGFHNAAAHDFTPTSASATINKGTPLYNAAFCGTFDHEGNDRFFGTSIDIGAYEFQGFPAGIVNASGTIGTFAIVYPNPARDMLHIKAGKTISELTVKDLQGQKMIQLNHNVGSAIDLSALSNGMYFVEVAFEDGSIEIQKIVKQY